MSPPGHSQSARSWLVAGLICGLFLAVPPMGDFLVFIATWMLGIVWIPALGIWGIVRMKRVGLLRQAMMAAAGSLFSFMPVFWWTVVRLGNEWEAAAACTILVPGLVFALSPRLARSRWLNERPW